METNEIKTAVASLLKDKSKRDELAEMLVEYVPVNHITTDFIGMLLNTRRLNPGDSLVKKLREGMKVRTFVPGSIHLSSEITVTDRVNYVLDGADIKVGFNAWDMENGDIGTVDEIKREMLGKINDYYQNKVFTALSSVWTAGNTPDNFTSVGGTITATALEDAIDRINQTTPGVKAVIGTRAAMTPITKFGAFWNDGGTQWTASDPAIEEIRQTGMLGKYYGAPLLVIDQIYDNLRDYNKLIPENKILVIGENVGEFITYGDLKFKAYDDPRPTPPYMFMEYYQQFGFMIWNAQGIYVIGGLS